MATTDPNIKYYQYPLSSIFDALLLGKVTYIEMTDGIARLHYYMKPQSSCNCPFSKNSQKGVVDSTGLL